MARINGFGPWKRLIAFLLALPGVSAGAGIAEGIGMLAMAGGRAEKIESAKQKIEGDQEERGKG